MCLVTTVGVEGASVVREGGARPLAIAPSCEGGRVPQR